MSIEQQSNAPATKERLGTIPRQASVPPPVAPRRRNDTPARVAKVVIGLSVTATLGALAAAGLAGVGNSSPALGAYGAIGNAPAVNQVGFPMTSGSLQLDGLLVRPDVFSGDFSGVVRLTWTGAEAVAGSQKFSIDVRKNDKHVATLSGFMSGLEPGETVTVPVASTTNFVSGPLQFSLGTGVSELSAQGTVNLLNGLAALQSLQAGANGDVAMAMAGSTGDADHTIAGFLDTPIAGNAEALYAAEVAAAQAVAAETATVASPAGDAAIGDAAVGSLDVAVKGKPGIGVTTGH